MPSVCDAALWEVIAFRPTPQTIYLALTVGRILRGAARLMHVLASVSQI